jgi:hypothetical protein
MLSLPPCHANYRFAFVLLSLFSIMLNISQAQSVILTEVMFNTSEANSEFIEIYNYSESPIDLQNFKIKYYTISPDEIISQTSNYLLYPHQYAIIFEGDYDFENGIYNNLIPGDALIFKLDDNAFGSSGMANTSNRKIYLINSIEDTLDTYIYSADNDKDFSDERIDFSDSLWSNSKIINGTPGKKNSVSKTQFDISISNFYANKSFVILGESVNLGVQLKNIGSDEVKEFYIKVYYDENQNNKGENEEVIFNAFVPHISPGDSVDKKIIFTELNAGENKFIAEVEYPQDEFILNNFAQITIMAISINELPGDLLINEIMYAPKNDEPEWVEIYNKSEKEIDLNKYQIADNSDTLRVRNSRFILKPKHYIVFSDDSTIINFYPTIENLVVTNLPALNNSGDKIIVLDSLNRVIDSLAYFPDWGGNNGNSLERIDPTLPSTDKNSWMESIFPTPGLINSVTQKDYDLTIDSVFTIPENPLIDTKTKFLVKVKNIGKETVNFNITLFDDPDADSIANNSLETTDIFSLANNDSIIISLLNDYFVTNLTVNYIFKLNVQDDDTTNNQYLFQLQPSYPKSSILVNEIMYSPINFEPEWIELYNNSAFDIDINKWAIGDVLTNPVYKKIEAQYIFPKQSYLVITKSRSIYDFHKNINSAIIELPFANLNNDEDGIIIRDINNRIIDSIQYTNDWGGTGGRSLERINLDFVSTNKNNWKTSIDLEGSTPGRINSVTPKKYDLSICSILTDPKYPVAGDSINIIAKVNNFGNFNADNFSIEFSYRDKFRNYVLDTFYNLSLASNDSITIEANRRIFLTDTLTILAKITFESDEDKINNYIEKIIVPGFNENTVLINEIMFKPSAGNPEWIEIVNNSDSTINLKNWSVGDLTNSSIITESPTMLLPEEYIIISDYYASNIFDDDVKVLQTNFPNLSNIKDAVIIYDFRDAVIDSVAYEVSSSFNISTSLERVSLNQPSVDLSNWTFSLSPTKSTPGEENSFLNIPEYYFDDVVFTEIMFNPSETNSEFLEIFNRSEKLIEIGGWKIEDTKGEYYYISNNSFSFKPNNYFVIAADSSILENYTWLGENENITILNLSSLNLTNAGKKLYLKDIRNNIIDSLEYSETWHNSALTETKNISLEIINHNLSRNNGSNWSSSVNEFGASPGLQNSINVENLTTKAKLEIVPNPFSPDNDGFEDFTHINYNLTQPVSQIRVRIYDSKGRFIRSLVNNRPTGSKGTIIFDGLDRDKNPLRIGIYIILLEAINSNNNIVEVVKEVVVVARKL